MRSQLERRDWLKLNFAWVLYGLIFGLVNIVVAYNASEATWVKSRSSACTGSMFLFMVGPDLLAAPARQAAGIDRLAGSLREQLTLALQPAQAGAAR